MLGANPSQYIISEAAVNGCFNRYYSVVFCPHKRVMPLGFSSSYSSSFSSIFLFVTVGHEALSDFTEAYTFHLSQDVLQYLFLFFWFIFRPSSYPNYNSVIFSVPLFNFLHTYRDVYIYIYIFF
jgi:hypothetical protein